METGKVGRGLLAAAIIALCAGVCPADELSSGEHEAMRREARERPRRIIMNNDGDDAAAYRYGRGEAPSDENLLEDFLDLRAPREGSQVDAVFYSTDRGSFGLFSHRTEVGTMFSEEHSGIGHNLVPRMYDMGTDPLAEYIKYCREKGIEIFWSMRMNDSHDWNREERRMSDFKRENPEFLLGVRGQRSPHGYWSGVDYARGEVRDFLYDVFEEMARNYDIDGIEMDFLRHMQIFRSVAGGGTAGEAEREKLTELVRRVREMLDREGMRRGRPFLLAVRAPDSVEFCRDMGIDIERWFELGLVDMFIPSGFFRLNDWEYSVELARAHGVRVYAGFEETRVTVDGRRDPLRHSLESYRGRAWEAWEAGVDGIYTFNLFNSDLPHYWQIGSPETLRGKERYHFVAVRDGEARIRRALSGGMDYRKRQVLTPGKPAVISPGEPKEFRMRGLHDPGESEYAHETLCRVRAARPGALRVSVNGRELRDRRVADSWLELGVPAGFLRPGVNRFEIEAREPADDARSVEWTADRVPEWPWTGRPSRENVFAELRDGALLVADRGTEPGDYLYYSYPWNISPAGKNEFEAEARVLSGWNAILVSNGKAWEQVRLFTDRVSLRFAGMDYEMDTTDDFHTYRVEVEGEDIRVYVDGELRVDGRGMFTTPSPDGRNNVSFGGSSSSHLGEALWRAARLSVPGAGVNLFDLMIKVDFNRG